jgi:amidase
MRMPRGLAALAFGLFFAPSIAKAQDAGAPPSIPIEEASIAGLRKAMDSGAISARDLVEAYLARIEEIDRLGPALHAVIEVNPEALEIAGRLDTERAAKGPRGPLHGIPVLIKDNIDTADRMATSAGSLALARSIAKDDAFIVKRLREAGAVILGKTNLSEWANFRSTHSSSGWSARGGQTRNPYVLDRNPCGSSSGTGAAIAANLAVVGVGTETDGSITCPAAVMALVGIKPTVGLVSRSGIIPISHSQDTAGPMARTVADAALLLGVLAGADPQDASTRARPAPADYSKSLAADGLRGARIGVARKGFMGKSPAADEVVDEAIRDLARLGAVVVDPADIPNAGTYDDDELAVLEYEFKADLDRYLGRLGAEAPVHSLAELIAFNEKNAAAEMPFFGQEIFLSAQKRGPLVDPRYEKARRRILKLAGERGIDTALRKDKLDALVTLTSNPAWPTDLVNGDHFVVASTTAPAVAGYPHVTVPAGQVRGLPVGISFIGRKDSEAALIRFAYAYEQGTRRRMAPRFLRTLDAH